jgi:hypothetical protein
MTENKRKIQPRGTPALSGAAQKPTKEPLKHASHTDEECCPEGEVHVDVDVHVHVEKEPCEPECGKPGEGTGPGTGPGRPGDTGGKIPDPPSGVAHNPWDIIQVILQTCEGTTPPPRKDSYLPYLVVRANPQDRGQRPLPNGTVFWESPDIFVVPNQPAAGAPAVPASLGGMAQAGAPNSLYAHVWNLGRGPAFDVRVEFYWFNPSLGIEEADANLIGFTYVTLGNRNSPTSHTLVRCPVDWIPTFVNNGHECLVVRAFSPISDPLGANAWNSAQNRHVGQRNIAVLSGAQAQLEPLILHVAPGHSEHAAQILTVTPDPHQVPWMQLLTGKRDPVFKPSAASPLIGLTTPTVALDPGARRPNLAALSPEALAQVISPQHSFQRLTDPMEVQLVARAARMTADTAHVVRVQQLHDGQMVGGYTTILLP